MGSADLPLHHGRVPAWLGERMTRLAQVLVEAIILHYGRDELLRRLAHPFWFQSFGAVMGMDWHSSGITTSVVGALKRGLNPIAHELGLHVCGGRGRHSRKTPDELLRVAESTGLDGAGLARTSRLVAKVDSAAVQDGFQLYLHSFVVTDDGAWVVIQQGMRTDNRQARRYHWQSEGLHDLVDEPHAAIEGPQQGTILNLTDHRAVPSRRAQVELAGDGPDHVVDTLRRLGDEPMLPFSGGSESDLHLTMPAGHALQVNDVLLRRLHGNLAAAADCGPKDFADLLLVPGIGARTVQALSLVSEVIHGAPCRFSDPARFSLAHGGKDGHPFPVPLDVFDHTMKVMRDAVAAARLGNDDKLAAIRRLDEQSRRLEGTSPGPDLQRLIEQERQRSPDLGGRTVFDGGTRASGQHRQPSGKRSRKERDENGSQLRLPGLDESGYR
jgi:hypothetical protein